MRIFHRAGLILCLAAVLVSAEIGCPYPEDVYPCTCVESYRNIELTCHHVDDSQVLLRVFENSRRYTFEKFNLERSTLQYIPHQIFDDVRMNNFFMVNVTLRKLFDEVPRRNPGMTDISANGVKILGGLDWKLLAPFKYMDSIFIIDMPLKKLTIDSLSHVSKNLRCLRCMNCKIKKLEDNLFADFSRLVLLVLADNEIVDIRRSMFPSELIRLDLDSNKISTLPEDMFSDMPFLRFVLLTGNMIAVLPEATFKPVISQLEFLEVRKNPIKCDCQIKWVLEAKSGVVQGECYAPKALHDKEFNQLTRRDIRC